MRKKYIIIAILLLGVILLTGCGGGNSSISDEQQIHKVLDDYQSAFLAQDVEKIVDLFHYPWSSGELEVTTKEEAIILFTFAFAFSEPEEMMITERNLIISGTSATVEGIVKSTDAQDQEDSYPISMELRKINGSWKITKDNQVE